VFPFLTAFHKVPGVTKAAKNGGGHHAIQPPQRSIDCHLVFDAAMVRGEAGPFLWEPFMSNLTGFE